MQTGIYRMTKIASAQLATGFAGTRSFTPFVSKCGKLLCIDRLPTFRQHGSNLHRDISVNQNNRRLLLNTTSDAVAAGSLSRAAERVVDMEVTASNFKQLLPDVQKALEECVFFAFDCEFTGLAKEEGRQMYLDDLDDRYKQMLSSSQSFLVNQFGLSAFSPNPEGGYTARTFNFYLFPRPCEGYDKRFLCQASSLAFLAKQGFDFNKFVREGISNMPLELRDYKLQQADQTRERNDILIRKPADVAFVAELKEKVTTWLKGSDRVLLLDEVNSYLRAIQFQQLDKDQFGVESDGPGFYVERVDVAPNRSAIQLVRATSEEVRAWKEGQKEMKREAIRDATGFSVVFEMIRDSGKPAVGHNLGLDLAYSISSFAQNLPTGWKDYKSAVQRWFPGGIYDTKYCAAQLARDVQLNTTLGDLYSGLNDGAVWDILLNRVREGGSMVADSTAPPAIQHAEGFTRYVGASVAEFAHEAGYDAFMTGAVFAHLVSLYDLKHGQELEEGEEQGPMALGAVREAMGRMNMMRSDYPYAALFGPDPVPDRSAIFVMVNLPVGTRISDVSALADKAGIGSVRVTVPFGSSHAFLEVQDGDLINEVVEKFDVLDDFPYNVSSYSEWKSGKDYGMNSYFGEIDGGAEGGKSLTDLIATTPPPKRRRA